MRSGRWKIRSRRRRRCATDISSVVLSFARRARSVREPLGAGHSVPVLLRRSGEVQRGLNSRVVFDFGEPFDCFGAQYACVTCAGPGRRQGESFFFFFFVNYDPRALVKLHRSVQHEFPARVSSTADVETRREPRSPGLHPSQRPGRRPVLEDLESAECGSSGGLLLSRTGIPQHRQGIRAFEAALWAKVATSGGSYKSCSARPTPYQNP